MTKAECDRLAELEQLESRLGRRLLSPEELADLKRLSDLRAGPRGKVSLGRKHETQQRRRQAVRAHKLDWGLSSRSVPGEREQKRDEPRGER